MTDTPELPAFVDEIAPIETDELSVQIATAPEERQWMPTDIASAEWCALRYLAADAELAGIKGHVRRYVERVNAWAQHTLSTGRAAELERTKAYMQDRLERFMLTTRELSPTRRDGKPAVTFIDLPSGRLSTRKVKRFHGALEVTDDDAALAWCEQHHPEFVVKTIDHKALLRSGVVATQGSDVVDPNTGEKVPGFRYAEPIEDVAVTVRFHGDEEPS